MSLLEMLKCCANKQLNNYYVVTKGVFSKHAVADVKSSLRYCLVL